MPHALQKKIKIINKIQLTHFQTLRICISTSNESNACYHEFLEKFILTENSPGFAFIALVFRTSRGCVNVVAIAPYNKKSYLLISFTYLIHYHIQLLIIFIREKRLFKIVRTLQVNLQETDL